MMMSGACRVLPTPALAGLPPEVLLHALAFSAVADLRSAGALCTVSLAP